MPRKRKQITMTVTVSVNAWMTAAQARREVRCLINNQSNYMSHGGWQNGYDEISVKARSVRPAR